MTGKVFRVHRGVAAPMLMPNIDTDAIIPSREMKRVSKLGLGKSLFAGWRFEDGTRESGLKSDFVLNHQRYAGTSILITGPNMGCGSSREFAVWALVDFGIRAIIAPSFGSIFYTNCIRNSLLPIVLDVSCTMRLAEQVSRDPQRNLIEIDLPACRIKAPDGSEYVFHTAPSHRKMLLEGLDAIDMTLLSEKDIDRFRTQDRRRRPWAHLD